MLLSTSLYRLLEMSYSKHTKTCISEYVRCENSVYSNVCVTTMFYMRELKDIQYLTAVPSTILIAANKPIQIEVVTWNETAIQKKEDLTAIYNSPKTLS